jgi:hypothetical protein
MLDKPSVQLIDMDQKSIEQFARIGLIKVLMDAAEDTAALHDQTDSRQLKLDI